MKRGLRNRLACALAVCVFSPVALAQPAWWRSPAAPEVAWRGMLVTDGGAVGASGQMLYPAPGVAGLLVAIFTHAAIVGGVQSAERKREQELADKVLEPYAAEIKSWTASALWDAALSASNPELRLQRWEGSGAPPGLLIETVPVFTLAQDESVLVLDLAVRLKSPQDAAAKEQVVRVVSSPHNAADARAHWSADSAGRMKATSAGMLAHALQMALLPPLKAGEEPPMRTHRYLQGSNERAERAQQVGGDCARAVLRTLRGWLMSVPLKPAEGSTCEQKTSF